MNDLTEKEMRDALYAVFINEIAQGIGWPDDEIEHETKAAGDKVLSNYSMYYSRPFIYGEGDSVNHPPYDSKVLDDDVPHILGEEAQVWVYFIRKREGAS